MRQVDEEAAPEGVANPVVGGRAADLEDVGDRLWARVGLTVVDQVADGFNGLPRSLWNARLDPLGDQGCDQLANRLIVTLDGGNDPAVLIALALRLVEDRVRAHKADERDEVTAEASRAGRHQLPERPDERDEDSRLASCSDPRLELVPGVKVERRRRVLFLLGEDRKDTSRLLRGVVGAEARGSASRAPDP